MVIAILEPVLAGIMVSLINKYVLSGSCSGWLQNSSAPEQVREDENEVVEDDEGKRYHQRIQQLAMPMYMSIAIKT